MLGDPMEGGTAQGPLISAGQLEMVSSQVAAGIAEGATALTGGKRAGGEFYPKTMSFILKPMNFIRETRMMDSTGDRCNGFGNGYFMEPTVLADVTPSMSCFQDEIFGPVVSVSKFSDEAGAIACEYK